MTENGSKTIENYHSCPWHTAVLFCLVTTPSRALWIVASGLDLGTEGQARRNMSLNQATIDKFVPGGTVQDVVDGIKNVFSQIFQVK